MAQSDPGEWGSVTMADATRFTEAGPARASVKIGTAQSLDWVGPCVRLQVDNVDVILPPEAASRMIGALERALREVATLAANGRRW